MESVIELMQHNIALYSVPPSRTSALIKDTLAQNAWEQTGTDL
jgi:hypothetical protein